jgi:hypothetical protein
MAAQCRKPKFKLTHYPALAHLAKRGSMPGRRDPLDLSGRLVSALEPASDRFAIAADGDCGKQFLQFLCDNQNPCYDPRRHEEDDRQRMQASGSERRRARAREK